MFNEGYVASTTAERRDLAEDARWLAQLIVRLMPDEPEAVGLLALMTLQLAGAAARFTPEGRLVLLEDQDRSRWDHAAIADGVALLERAGRMRRSGPYQLQAAIAACHAEAASWEETDWTQIFMLYEGLARVTGSSVVRLNRAIALSHVAGPARALAEVDEMADELDRYHLFHSTRAWLLRQLERDEEARDADRRALTLTENPAERALLMGGSARDEGMRVLRHRGRRARGQHRPPRPAGHRVPRPQPAVPRTHARHADRARRDARRPRARAGRSPLRRRPPHVHRGPGRMWRGRLV